MKAVSLSWWSQSQLERLGELLQGDFDRWECNWVVNVGEGASRTPTRIQVNNGHEISESIRDCQWTWLGGGGSASAWLGHVSPLTEAVAKVLFDDSCLHSPVGSRIAIDAFDELRSALASTLRLHPAAQESQEKPSEHWAKPWSGHVFASIRHAGSSLRLLIGPECVAALLNTAHVAPSPRVGWSALTSASDALGAHAIQVRAGFAPFEIDVGSLLSLDINDVLQLSHRLDAPLLLSNDTLGDLCHCYLGKREGQLAVELVGSTQATRTV
jgi:hypothetical protein